ncbi:MAG: cation:proton antiporter [Candidatus Ozemobacteraceae bacterium]
MGNEDILVSLLIFLAGIISLEIGVSVAILEITAGIAAGNLFHLMSSDWIDHLSLFGLLGLMFFAGFETDVKLLKKNWRSSISIGFASFLLPFSLVFILGYNLSGLELMEALLVSIGLSTTSVALLYAIFKEKPLADPEYQQLLLSAAMVVDITSIFMLAFIFEGLTAISVLIFVFCILFLAHIPKIGKWLVLRYPQDHIEIKMRFVLLVLLSMVLLSKQASIHVSLFGFFIGIFFSEFMEEDKELAAKLKSLVFGLMAPVFFFKAGLYVRLASLKWSMLPSILLFGIVAYLAKYIGTYYSARLFLPEKISKLGGLTFNVRLSFGIIAATFGLESGILRQEMFLTMILIVVGASIITSLLIRYSGESVISIKKSNTS